MWNSKLIFYGSPSKLDKALCEFRSSIQTDSFDIIGAQTDQFFFPYPSLSFLENLPYPNMKKMARKLLCVALKADNFRCKGVKRSFLIVKQYS